MSYATTAIRGTPAPMGKPKMFSETLFVRVPEGTRERIEKVRGDVAQADYLREMLMADLKRAERRLERIADTQNAADETADESPE